MTTSKFLKVATFLVVASLLSSNALADSSLVNRSDLSDWIVKKISSWSPPGKTFYPEAAETEKEALDRYESIASDVLDVAFDPTETPIFNGPSGRIRTAALILAVARAESGFRKDVDFGIGPQSKGDGGRSWCLMQIMMGHGINGKTKTRISLNDDEVKYTSDPDDLGGEDLISDRKQCFRVGMRLMRKSFNACSRLPILERLASYASGSCNGGKDASKNRIGMAVKWISTSPPPMNDSQYRSLLNPNPVVNDS